VRGVIASLWVGAAVAGCAAAPRATLPVTQARSCEVRGALEVETLRPGPQLRDDGRIHAMVRARAIDASDLDLARASVSWGRGEDERMELGAPFLEQRAPGGREAYWEVEVPARAWSALVDVRAEVRCSSTRASTDAALVAGPTASAEYCGRLSADGRRMRIESEAHVVVIEARCGVMLRRVDRALIDACDGRVVLDLDALGAPLADVVVAEDTRRLTPRELAGLASGLCAPERATLRFGAPIGEGVRLALEDALGRSDAFTTARGEAPRR
jgi:hypothetical protein